MASVPIAEAAALPVRGATCQRLVPARLWRRPHPPPWPDRGVSEGPPEVPLALGPRAPPLDAPPAVEPADCRVHQHCQPGICPASPAHRLHRLNRSCYLVVLFKPWWGSWVAWGSPKIWGYPAYPPMIASWPAGIKQPERIVDDLVEFCELMPTLCEVTFETR